MKSEPKGKKGGGEAPPASEHYQRYPEEEFIDEQEEDKPGPAGTELAEHFRSVTAGRQGHRPKGVIGAGGTPEKVSQIDMPRSPITRQEHHTQ